MKTIATIVVLVGSVLFLSATAPPDIQQAVVIHNSGCNLILANGTMGLLAANRDVRVYTSGPKMRMCYGTVDNPSGKAIHFDYGSTGKMCEVNGGATEIWSETISASGQVSLHCRLP